MSPMLSVCLFVAALCSAAATPPNIVMFIADDLGWNDVGFHGSNVVPTPNIDALAYSGVSLHNYHVAPICTPSRAALMTGKYPIHTGMQHGVLYGTEPRGLPLSEKILPQYLKDLGYKTHLVGKWHLGSYKKEYLPLNRGFDSHLGYWTGRIDMFDHTSMERGSWGFDFRRGFDIAHDLFGKYATDIYTNEAIRLISSHNKTEPLFLMVAHSAMHSGNPAEPIRAPDKDIDKFSHIQNYQRRKYAAVLSKLDESVGLVVAALQEHGLLDHSVLVFSTDNGGPAAGFNDNAASNYPLRGVKNTLWEGGVRGAGLVWSPLLGARGRLAAERLHVVDWLPTLLAAAGHDHSLPDMDGVSQWAALCGAGDAAGAEDAAAQRTQLVLNIDDIYGTAAITDDHWKLLIGTNYNGSWDSWYGPAERDGSYDVEAVYRQPVGAVMQARGVMPDRTTVAELREAATIKCGEVEKIPCNPGVSPCLFNIENDPCEYSNLAEKEPAILQRMLSQLARVNATALPPNNRPAEPRADPKYWGHVFTNFGDYLTF